MLKAPDHGPRQSDPAPTKRTVTRRRFTALAGVLSAGVVGCAQGASGPQAGDAKPAGAPAAKPTGPIRVQQWDAPSSPFGLWLKEYLESFPAKSGIQLEILPRKTDVTPSQEQTIWVAAGDVPDIFFRTGRGLVPYAVFASKNVIRPLDPFIKRDKWDQSDFWPNLIKLMTAKAQQWVIPQDFNQTLFAYNVSFLKQAGVAAPPSDWKNQSWTWDELVKRAQQIQGRIGADGTKWALGRVQGNWPLYVWSNGGDYLSTDGKKVLLAEASAVEALDFVAKILHTHRVAPTPSTPLPPGSALGTQSVAMDNLAAAGINAIRGQSKDLDFDTCLVPRASTGKYVSGGGGGGYVMSSSSKHPDAAWELLKYIGAKEYATNKVKNGALGPRISTAKEVFVQPGIPPVHAAVYFDAPANARWEPNLTNWDDVQSDVGKALTPLWNGTVSAREAAAEAKRAFDLRLTEGELFQ
ncbi:MAG TPA: extracellular solute-binding protein [Chloroflexota bacterium]|nr:extracellular solute-binding protein [Chloroflexota bacterium]